MFVLECSEQFLVKRWDENFILTEKMLPSRQNCMLFQLDFGTAGWAAWDFFFCLFCLFVSVSFSNKENS